MYLVYACSVKKFYRSVKIPDQVGDDCQVNQVGDDVWDEIPDQVGDDLLIKSGMTALSRHCRLDHPVPSLPA